MMHRFRYRIIFIFVVLTAMGALIASCAPKPRLAGGEMDTPAHHTSVGMKYIDQGRYADAQREFDLALELDRKYSQAHTGAGLAKAYRNDFAAAFESMKKADKYAKTPADKEFMKVGFIRLHTMNRAADKKWLDKAEDEFDDIESENPKSAAAHYFMGAAYKEALDFNKAAPMFARVIELNTGYTEQANDQWRLIQKIQRALPGTLAGKRIALHDQVSRADVAALFMEELKIDVVYKKRSVPTFDTGFKDPVKAKGSGTQILSAKDIGDHPLKADIEDVLKMQVRGLEVFPDGTFRPDQFIDRATYAMMIEDILTKITGDNALATKHIGSPSPFPDLRADQPYFNAAMVMTTRGIMEVKNMATGEFAPLGPVPGADALLVIRKLKDQLKIF
ncbi:MAG: S-layer homology domain-containing protein [Deltaproteobacteria bacterium]|nr:S-layer homology domain-containing protein [Deltaproteobacteria bacterium]